MPIWSNRTFRGTSGENFRTSREQESNSNSFQARIDHHFSTSDNIFFRWTERRINAFIPRGDRGFQEPDSINRNWGGGWFHTFTPTMVLEVRGGLATQPTEDAPSSTSWASRRNRVSIFPSSISSTDM